MDCNICVAAVNHREWVVKCLGQGVVMTADDPATARTWEMGLKVAIDRIQDEEMWSQYQPKVHGSLPQLLPTACTMPTACLVQKKAVSSSSSSVAGGSWFRGVSQVVSQAAAQVASHAMPVASQVRQLKNACSCRLCAALCSISLCITLGRHAAAGRRPKAQHKAHASGSEERHKLAANLHRQRRWAGHRQLSSVDVVVVSCRLTAAA